MILSQMNTPVSSVNGVGPALTKQLSRLNIFTVGDLLQFYPKDYEDRTKKVFLRDFQTGKVNTIVQVMSHEWFGYGKMKTLKINVTDGSAKAALACFNKPFMENAFPVGSIASLNGKFEVKYGSLQSSSFEMNLISRGGGIQDYVNTIPPNSCVLPVYPLTEGLTRKKLHTVILQALNQYGMGISDELPPEIMEKRKILPKKEAVYQIHNPATMEAALEARRSLVYETFFTFQSMIAKRAFRHRGSLPKIQLDNFNLEGEFENPSKVELTDLSPLQKQLLESLPFELTNDQKAAISAMNYEIDRGFTERNKIILSEKTPLMGMEELKNRPPFTMARLLQGDVGSGKTLVALFACLRVKNWKGQCAFMAPTEILAKQHAKTIADYLDPLGVRTAFLSGNVKAGGRNQLLKALKEGDIDILIGTHALFSSQVVYNDLQLAVIDEQHRFGVMQRESIIAKGRKSEESGQVFEPHLLMMSATPIPQTLALTAFGDLDVTVIKTMPNGRKPVQTYLVKEGNEQNAYEAVRKELQAGHQAYFVYPAIGIGDEEDFVLSGEDGGENSRGLKSAVAAFENLSKNIYPEYKCALVHSKIESEEQEKILADFKDGKIQILAATTVIEVGVDVKNATCIVIEAADRFGMSQIHQLRGRVGRNDLQSYCFLVYSERITETGKERMKVLRQSTDGFFIAEADLKNRGPGEVMGTMQSGELDLGLADIKRDNELLLLARTDSFQWFSGESNGKKQD